MTFLARRHRPRHGWDMTPMIDVVLQLIIFFMYTAQFSHLLRSPLDLPAERGERAEARAPAAFVVDVLRTGQLVVEREPITLDRLAGMIQLELARAGPDAARVDVLVRAHRDAPAAHLNAIAARLAAIGVRSWRLGTADQPLRPAAADGTGP